MTFDILYFYSCHTKLNSKHNSIYFIASFCTFFLFKYLLYMLWSVYTFLTSQAIIKLKLHTKLQQRFYNIKFDTSLNFLSLHFATGQRIRFWPHSKESKHFNIWNDRFTDKRSPVCVLSKWSPNYVIKFGKWNLSVYDVHWCYLEIHILTPSLSADYCNNLVC